MTAYLEVLEAELAGVDAGDCTFDEPDAPIYLTGVSTAATRELGHPGLGLLAQPGNSVILDVERYPVFAADNGCFAKGDAFDVDAWLAWVVDEVVPRAERCLFVVAPDVVGDAAATIARSARVLPVLRKLGLPAAFVAQDGLERLEVPWDDFDVLFIGGSTEWKLSPAAAELSAEARRQGKWVHVGRVNSWRRLALVRAHHADSADGTFLAYGPKVNLPRLVGWLERLAAEAAPVADIRDPLSPTVRVPPSTFDYGALTAGACALLLDGRRFCGAPSVGPGWPCRHHTLELLACFAAQLPPSHLGAWRHRSSSPPPGPGQLPLFDVRAA